ncbi:MAG: hypothetical protein BAX61_05185 [Psychrobacter sp. B29-1]|nr:MAG: hypothetical protein BAX61_05185 [Psychrobacter sp. B29-1]
MVLLFQVGIYLNHVKEITKYLMIEIHKKLSEVNYSLLIRLLIKVIKKAEAIAPAILCVKYFFKL